MINDIDVILMDNNRQLLARGITAQKGDNEIIATIVEVTRLGAQIRKGDGVVVKHMNNATGVNIFSGTITTIKGSVVVIDGLKIMSQLQRRRELKVKVRFDAQLYRMTKHDTYLYKVRVVDISAGGVGFNTRENLDINDRYYYLFDRNGKDISAKTEILRQKPIDGGFFYGCRFVDVSREDEENIRRFVYTMQIQQSKLNRQGIISV